MNINTYKVANRHLIVSTHPFSKNEYLIVNLNEESLVFTVPTIDFRGKQLKTVKACGNSRQIGIYTYLLKVVNYAPDELSTDDELIIHF